MGEQKKFDINKLFWSNTLCQSNLSMYGVYWVDSNLFLALGSFNF